MRLRIAPDEHRRTTLTLQGQDLEIRLVEDGPRKEREPTEKERQEMKKYGSVYFPNLYVYEPTGRLKLGIIGSFRSDIQKAVADGKQQRVEQRLNEFVVKLEEEAVRRKQHNEYLERQRRAWEEEARRRREREERQRKEIERFKALEEEVRNWKRAEDIRSYVSAAEAQVLQDSKAIDPGSELGQWIVWARQKADWLDPLVETKCPILDE